MKKALLAVAAMATVAPLFVAAGAAQAATTFTPELVYTFNSESNTDFEVAYIASFGNKVAIELDNGDMWVSDGTAAGTIDMSDALAAEGITDVEIDRDYDTTKSLDIDGTLYFLGYDGSIWDIYTTDGSGVTQLTTGLGGNDALYYLGGDIYVMDNAFEQVDPVSGDIVLIEDSIDCNWTGATQVQLVGGLIVYIYDNDGCDDVLNTWNPASPLTAPVEITASLGGLGSNVEDIDYLDDTENTFFMFEGEMYFAAEANDGSNALGVELFKTDGTQAGTVLVKDIRPGGDDSESPDDSYMTPTIFNGEMYFSAYNGTNAELWKTDGTTAGTVVAVSNPTDPGDNIQAPAVEINGKLFMDFETAEAGKEYYVTDGTEAGTTLLKDINVGTEYSVCQGSCVQPVLFDNHVFFVAYDGTTNALWATDGTPEGTVQVTTFGSEYAIGNQNDSAMVIAGDNMFFGVADISVLPGEPTGEMSLYKISSASPQLANTGADLRAGAFGALGAMALVAFGGALVIARRRNAQV